MLTDERLTSIAESELCEEHLDDVPCGVCDGILAARECLALRARVKRMEAPVSRHDDHARILQRYFLTGGRQYRYTNLDANDLWVLINEFVAARAHEPQKENAN
jgi:hypothetical protein